MPTVTLQPVGPYSLGESIRFLEGFTPAAYAGDEPGRLDLAFVSDEAFLPGGVERVVGASVRDERGAIDVELSGDADLVAARRQIERILSLDVDGDGFPEVGRRDPVVGRLQTRYPGLRPVLFLSPYEAAAWAIIGNRIRIVQAAKIKSRLAEEIGPSVTVAGRTAHAFPPPARLAQLDAFPGLSDRKVAYLRQLGQAATSDLLDAARLRSLPADQALAELQTLPGIGPFGAELVLLRGAGAPDLLPTHEPRLARAIARAYDLQEPPSPDQIASLAEPWRPYRSWVVVLLRTMLEEETAEISHGGIPRDRSVTRTPGAGD